MLSLFFLILAVRKILNLILILSSISIFGSAQNISVAKHASLVVGGDMWGSMKYQLRDSPDYQKINFEGDIKLGYFISNNDLFLIKSWCSFERLSWINSIDLESDLYIGGVISYRRYLGNSLFGGLYFGGEYTRMFGKHSTTPTIGYDKEITAGMELGYSYFFNHNIGIESSIYYSAVRISVIREEKKFLDATRTGIKVGFLYLIKLKKQSNDYS